MAFKQKDNVQMYKLKIGAWFWIVPAVVSAISAYQLTSSGRDQLAFEEQFPQRIPQSVFLHRNNEGRIISYVDYGTAGNARFKTKSQTFYNDANDNVVETATYRPSGTAIQSEKVYPSLDGKPPVRRRLAFYDLDGTTFLSHEVNRKDGTRERFGKRYGVQYRSQYYYADGVTLRRDRNFYPTGREVVNYVLDSERLLRKDGTVESETYRIADHYYKKVFDPNGLRLAALQMTPGAGLSGEIYAADGKTLLAVVKDQPMESGYVATFYRSDKTQAQVRRVRGSMITDTYFAEDGERILFQQVWRKFENHESKSVSFKLQQLVEFDQNNNELRTFNIEDGKFSTAVSKIEPGKILVEYFDKEGDVYKTETKRGSEVVAFDIFDESVPNRRFDAHWFVMSTPVKIEEIQFTDPGSPPWIYDYEDNKNRDLI